MAYEVLKQRSVNTGDSVLLLNSKCQSCVERAGEGKTADGHQKVLPILAQLSNFFSKFHISRHFITHVFLHIFILHMNL